MHRGLRKSAGTAWSADLRPVLPVGPGIARERETGADDEEPRQRQRRALTACGETRVSAEAGQFSRWGRGARLTRRVREEYRVYFDRNATMSGAKRRGSAGMDRRPNAVWVSPQAANPGWRNRSAPPRGHGFFMPGGVCRRTRSRGFLPLGCCKRGKTRTADVSSNRWNWATGDRQDLATPKGPGRSLGCLGLARCCAFGGGGEAVGEASEDHAASGFPPGTRSVDRMVS